MAVSPTHHLCLSCGICCEGTFFSYGPLQDDEPVDDYRRAGLEIQELENGERRMPLPCKQFKDGKCQTYECRPISCQEYRCRLIRRLERGAVDLETALGRVEVAKSKRARLQAKIAQAPELADLSFPEALAEMDRNETSMTVEEHEAFRMRHAEMFLLAADLTLYILKHFHVRSGVKKSLDEETARFLLSGS